MKSKFFQKSQNKAEIGQKSQNWPKRPKFSKKPKKKPKISKIWLFCQVLTFLESFGFFGNFKLF
jgi:hypothetical protein